MNFLLFHSLDDPLWPGPSPRASPLCTSLVTTLCKFYRCSKSMRTIALCMHCERWITVPLWRNNKRALKSESSQPWLSESVVTQPWVKQHTGVYCWRQKLRLETTLRFINARFAKQSGFITWWSWWDFAMTDDIL